MLCSISYNMHSCCTSSSLMSPLIPSICLLNDASECFSILILSMNDTTVRFLRFFDAYEELSSIHHRHSVALSNFHTLARMILILSFQFLYASFAYRFSSSFLRFFHVLSTCWWQKILPLSNRLASFFFRFNRCFFQNIYSFLLTSFFQRTDVSDAFSFGR